MLPRALTIPVFCLVLAQAGRPLISQQVAGHSEPLIRNPVPSQIALVTKAAATGGLSGFAASNPIPIQDPNLAHALQATTNPAGQTTPTNPARQNTGTPTTGAAQAPRTNPQTPAGTATVPRQAPKPAATPAQTQPAPQEQQPDCGGFPCDAQPQPKVVAVNPPPVTPPWTWHERIQWAAYVILAFVAYAGVMTAVMTMKKIERQTAAAEVAADAAQKSAEAALKNAQAVIDSERPWLLITVEPSLSVEDGFTVLATNRGKSPAQIAGTAERIRTAADESGLPKTPEYDNREPTPPMVPIILLPGESTGLKSFSRADARALCDSDEQFKRIENWEEKIYLYGKVIYRDLIATATEQMHQTDWCCWYIHGRQKSGMVIGGPATYNMHT